MMRNDDLTGKKLLLVGGVGAAADLVELAHRNGVFIGVADYNKDTYVKRIADAAHEVNALDVDAIVELCEREGYTGVMSNFSDLLSPYVAQIAERIGGYSPFTVEQLKMSTDKKYFKDTCLRYGVPVPQEYKLASIEEVDGAAIEYPVIVKPVDGSGSKGVVVCHDPEELKKGLASAMQASRSGDAICEQYLPYDEINVTYIIQDGDVQLAAIHDRYFNTQQQGVIRVPDMYIYPSRYTELYLRTVNNRVISMLEGIGLKNGSLFMQAIVKGDQIYFYEAGMRLNGCKTYSILEVENDFNTFERLMRYALVGDMGKKEEFDPRFKRWYATWCVVGRPGATCAQFVGAKELETYPWLIKIGARYTEGDVIPESAKGTLVQLVARIHLYGDTKEQLMERIDRMQKLYRVFDDEGNDALLTPHDIEDLRRSVNYELFER